MVQFGFWSNTEGVACDIDVGITLSALIFYQVR